MTTKKEVLEKIGKQLDKVDVLEYAEKVAIESRLKQLNRYKENTDQFRKSLECGGLKKNSTLSDLKQVEKSLGERLLYYDEGEGNYFLSPSASKNVEGSSSS